MYRLSERHILVFVSGYGIVSGPEDGEQPCKELLNRLKEVLVIYGICHHMDSSRRGFSVFVSGGGIVCQTAKGDSLLVCDVMKKWLIEKGGIPQRCIIVDRISSDTEGGIRSLRRYIRARNIDSSSSGTTVCIVSQMWHALFVKNLLNSALCGRCPILIRGCKHGSVFSMFLGILRRIFLSLPLRPQKSF